MIKKLISEFVGTMLLVLFGCGTAVAVNTYASLPYNHLVIAFAFGLILMAIVYIIGSISGAHVNPAVSIAMAIDKRMSILECVEYIAVQVLGAVAGAAIIGVLFNSFDALGANGFDTVSTLQMVNNGTVQVTTLVAFLVESILTFTFVLVVLSTTKEKNGFSGLAIGLALTLVHIFGLPFTGTSVNPARSIGPALLTANDSLAMNQLWLFIVAPIVGAVIAALFYKFVLAKEEK